MAETTVENQVCQTCGAEARSGALFCYNCGAAVAAQIAVVNPDNNETVSEERLLMTDGRENDFEVKSEQVEIKRTDAAISGAEKPEKPFAKPNVQAEQKLKSAASMRGKSKLAQSQKVEIIWEDRQAASNVWFIMAALILTALAAGILFLAIRLK